MLQGEIPGIIGSSMSGQRDAGTGFRQLSSSLDQFAQGGAPFNVGPLADAYGKKFAADTNRQAFDLREGFGAAGQRYGTPLATGEARLRSDALMGHDVVLGELFRQTHEGAQNRRLQAAGLNAQTLDALGQMAFRMMLPLLQLAGAGIMPNQTSFGPSPFSQVAGAVGEVGGAAAPLFMGPAGAAAPGIFGNRPGAR